MFGPVHTLYTIIIIHNMYLGPKEMLHRNAPFQEVHVENECILHSRYTGTSKYCANSLQNRVSPLCVSYWIAVYNIRKDFACSLLCSI